jgi:arylsulfatase A-like enzyme
MGTKRLLMLMFVLSAAFVAGPEASHAAAHPNVIVILADDLGFGDLGCYGQKLIQTPNLDRMAAEGMRFTQFYAGSTVCAPSRSVLMTGKHLGHTRVRGNAPEANLKIQALRKGDRTLAHTFRDAGYATALFGKWGLGEIGSDGHPNSMGFDEFFGYLNQRHAHNYYPSFLIHNSRRFPLRNVAEVENRDRGDGWARRKVDYSHDVIMTKALRWLKQNRRKPFFLYLAVTLPHANNEATRATGDGQEVPDYGIYKDKPWPNPDKGQAAMITRLDRDVGRLQARLKEYGIDESTLVIFSSDNGPHHEGNNNPDLFKPAGPLRGMKRALYEGGIRVPLLARWPGRIKAGSVSNHIGYFGDVFATVCELTSQKLPRGLDSVSFLPTLLGEYAKQQKHEYLYWEFYEQGGRQAVRFDNYKAIREPMFTGKVVLYDLSKDIGETRDIATTHPELVTRAIRMMNEAHVSAPEWAVSSLPARFDRVVPGSFASAVLLHDQLVLLSESDVTRYPLQAVPAPAIRLGQYTNFSPN